MYGICKKYAPLKGCGFSIYTLYTLGKYTSAFDKMKQCSLITLSHLGGDMSMQNMFYEEKRIVFYQIPMITMHIKTSRRGYLLL